ncbi:MAG: macro domain-containing protein [Lachnospiraceae bacterium]|nr:macro domain-containing protein [Lachnospiraceae bacterium]
MPLLFLRQDITKVKADAIVNTSNTKLLQGSGTSRAVFLAAGEEQLTKACTEVGECEIGHAVITPGFNLPSKYIIHVVGPIWMNGTANEVELLYKSYESALNLAKDNNIESIAFPLISAGNYKFPAELALSTAIDAINDFLENNDMTVYLLIYNKKVFEVSRNLSLSIKEYIDDKYVFDKDESYDELYEVRMNDALSQKNKANSDGDNNVNSNVNANVNANEYAIVSKDNFENKCKDNKETLEDLLNDKVETFTELLFRLIDERGMSDVEVYRKANIDRKLFSKIRSNVNYTPSKKTILCLAIALELNIMQANELLMKAGYTLSESSKLDVVVSYFLERGKYNILEINEVLFEYDLPMLG